MPSSDYENAGVYASALLDVYMDYKIMWRNIQTGSVDIFLSRSLNPHRVRNLAEIWELEHGQLELTAKVETPEVVKLRTEAKDDYKSKMKRYEESSKSPPNEEPMPPNDLVPYSATIFGLDKARRDCRFEMIKVVREVNSSATPRGNAL